MRLIKNKLPNSYDGLLTSGPVPGTLYGLPKVHKPGCPISPILSAINTYNHNLAKFFIPVLAPLTSNESTVKNSSTFTKDIQNVSLQHPSYMASFDVKSLFTNIPLIETINICVEQCHRHGLIPHNLTTPQFKSLSELAVKESVFQFNNKLYQQIDGVAMGLPVGPTLANAFLCYHESIWLKDCADAFRPLRYNRYVDDCFLIFKEKEHADRFLLYLNSKLNDISCTKDHVQNNILPFLDVSVIRENNKLYTDIYGKNTFTGMGLNYVSFAPQLFEVNLIKNINT